MEMTVTMLSAWEEKELLFDKKALPKNASWVDECVCWQYSMYVCVSICESVEEWTAFLPPWLFILSCLICAAINPPQNPTNTPKAQESFFHASCLHLASRPVSLYLFLSLCLCVHAWSLYSSHLLPGLAGISVLSGGVAQLYWMDWK